MFNSFTDWIKLPQQIPTVNIPKIPDIFGMNSSNNNLTEIVTNKEHHNNVEDNQPIPKESAENIRKDENMNSENTLEQKDQKRMPLDIDTSKAIGQAKELGSNIGSNLFDYKSLKKGTKIYLL
jgi:hypothetical protein